MAKSVITIWKQYLVAIMQIKNTFEHFFHITPVLYLSLFVYPIYL